jgi:regulator of protease activity HflC (stomatin/prohibitin superfamily)
MSPLQTAILVVIIAIGITGIIAAARAVRIVQQYERGVVFRLGRVRDGTRGPGPTLIVPGVDRLAKVNLQITVDGRRCNVGLGDALDLGLRPGVRSLGRVR